MRNLMKQVVIQRNILNSILEELQKLSIDNRGAVINVPDEEVQSLFSGTAQFPIDSEENLKEFEEYLRDEINFKGAVSN